MTTLQRLYESASMAWLLLLAMLDGVLDTAMYGVAQGMSLSTTDDEDE